MTKGPETFSIRAAIPELLRMGFVLAALVAIMYGGYVGFYLLVITVLSHIADKM